jgi:hypothetical protein
LQQKYAQLKTYRARQRNGELVLLNLSAH